MQEMSETFQIAFSMSNFNKEEAIKLYNSEIGNNPKNLAALNNRGLCKLELAQEKNDIKLLQESKDDFKKAIQIMDEIGGYNRLNGIDFNLKRAEDSNTK